MAGAEDLPWNDGVFDLALAQLVVHFMQDAVAGAREMVRVTRPGGAVAACTWDSGGAMTMVSTFWDAVVALGLPRSAADGRMRFGSPPSSATCGWRWAWWTSTSMLSTSRSSTPPSTSCGVPSPAVSDVGRVCTRARTVGESRPAPGVSTAPGTARRSVRPRRPVVGGAGHRALKAPPPGGGGDRTGLVVGEHHGLTAAARAPCPSVSRPSPRGRSSHRRRPVPARPARRRDG